MPSLASPTAGAGAPPPTKVMLRHLPPDMTAEAVAQHVARALAGAPPGAQASVVYVEPGKVKKDRSVVPTRACLEVRVPPEPSSGVFLPEYAEATLRALTALTATDANGEQPR